MAIAKKIEASISRASWIRKMFEQGALLKAQYGTDNVYDFTIGNPNLEPPAAFKQALQAIAQSPEHGLHGYMPNSGYGFARQAVADYVTREQHVPVTANEVVMTCGAAGALNVILKTLLDPGEEVLCPSPYFVEYGFYADNHGGVLHTVPTHPDFTLDLDAIAAAITPQTKALLINSPNNPTGQIYSRASLLALADLLRQRSQAYNKAIYLVSDEPYRKIVYDGVDVPSILECYPESLIITSYSKDLSIPGERIGFLAAHPNASNKELLMAGLNLSNRILGFVNAPALMQRIVASIQGCQVDVLQYQRKRDQLCEGLTACGYTVTKPAGAFYLFLKIPIADDVAFVNALQDELILTVPGSGFGGPGHIRIAYCVDKQTIVNAMPGFKRVLEKFQTR